MEAGKVTIWEFQFLLENGAIIEYNTIKNTGYIPLIFSGNNILIKNNIIDNYLLVKQDGGGIYT